MIRPLLEMSITDDSAEADRFAANSKFIDFCFLNGNAQYILYVISWTHHPCHRLCRIAMDRCKKM